MTGAAAVTAAEAPGSAKDDTRPMRTTALAMLAVGTLLVAGCSAPELTATDGGTIAPATATGTARPSTGSTSQGKASGSASPKPGPATSSPATAAPFPTAFIAVDKTITDAGLGHKIVVSRVLRALPWPAGYQATSAAYELVAVEMTFTPSTTYTAPLRVQDLSITTGSPSPSRPDTLDDPMLQAAQLTLLPAQVATGTSAKGWVVFRVDPKGAPKLTLTYTRPASKVTGNGQVFASQAFATDIVG